MIRGKLLPLGLPTSFFGLILLHPFFLWHLLDRAPGQRSVSCLGHRQLRHSSRGGLWWCCSWRRFAPAAVLKTSSVLLPPYQMRGWRTYWKAMMMWPVTSCLGCLLTTTFVLHANAMCYTSVLSPIIIYIWTFALRFPVFWVCYLCKPVWVPPFFKSVCERMRERDRN